MEAAESNHGSCGAQPWKLRSPSMEVAESNHALARVHGWTSASQSIEKIFDYLT